MIVLYLFVFELFVRRVRGDLPMCQKDVEVANIFAKYNNPIAEIVQKACTFESEIHAYAGTKRVNLKSIMGIMAFDWSEGMQVSIQAEGSDEEDAVSSIQSFLACN